MPLSKLIQAAKAESQHFADDATKESTRPVIDPFDLIVMAADGKRPGLILGKPEPTTTAVRAECRVTEGAAPSVFVDHPLLQSQVCAAATAAHVAVLTDRMFAIDAELGTTKVVEYIADHVGWLLYFSLICRRDAAAGDPSRTEPIVSPAAGSAALSAVSHGHASVVAALLRCRAFWTLGTIIAEREGARKWAHGRSEGVSSWLRWSADAAVLPLCGSTSASPDTLLMVRRYWYRIVLSVLQCATAVRLKQGMGEKEGLSAEAEPQGGAAPPEDILDLLWSAAAPKVATPKPAPRTSSTPILDIDGDDDVAASSSTSIQHVDPQAQDVVVSPERVTPWTILVRTVSSTMLFEGCHDECLPHCIVVDGLRTPGKHRPEREGRSCREAITTIVERRWLELREAATKSTEAAAQLHSEVAVVLDTTAELLGRYPLLSEVGIAIRPWCQWLASGAGTGGLLWSAVRDAANVAGTSHRVAPEHARLIHAASEFFSAIHTESSVAGSDTAASAAADGSNAAEGGGIGNDDLTALVSVETGANEANLVLRHYHQHPHHRPSGSQTAASGDSTLRWRGALLPLWRQWLLEASGSSGRSLWTALGSVAQISSDPPSDLCVAGTLSTVLVARHASLALMRHVVVALRFTTAADALSLAATALQRELTAFFDPPTDDIPSEGRDDSPAFLFVLNEVTRPRSQTNDQVTLVLLLQLAFAWMMLLVKGRKEAAPAATDCIARFLRGTLSWCETAVGTDADPPTSGGKRPRAMAEVTPQQAGEEEEMLCGVRATVTGVCAIAVVARRRLLCDSNTTIKVPCLLDLVGTDAHVRRTLQHLVLPQTACDMPPQPHDSDGVVRLSVADEDDLIDEVALCFVNSDGEGEEMLDVDTMSSGWWAQRGSTAAQSSSRSLRRGTPATLSAVPQSSVVTATQLPSASGHSKATPAVALAIVPSAAAPPMTGAAKAGPSDADVKAIIDVSVESPVTDARSTSSFLDTPSTVHVPVAPSDEPDRAGGSGDILDELWGPPMTGGDTTVPRLSVDAPHPAAESSSAKSADLFADLW